MNQSIAALVRVFHEKYGLPLAEPGPTPARIAPEASDTRRRILAQEYREYREAQDAGDVAAMAHEAADMIVVLYGDAATIGYDLDAAVAEVMRANMTKGPEVANGKPVKGPRFRPANVAAAIGLDRREPDPPLPQEAYDPKASWHTDAEM